MIPIALYDRLRIEPAAKTLFESNVPELQRDPTNLVMRALDAFQKLSGDRRDYRIVLEKHIPIGAGLGGGSSNAAGTLRAAVECDRHDQRRAVRAGAVGESRRRDLQHRERSGRERGEACRRDECERRRERERGRRAHHGQRRRPWVSVPRNVRSRHARRDEARTGHTQRARGVAQACHRHAGGRRCIGRHHTDRARVAYDDEPSTLRTPSL